MFFYKQINAHLILIAVTMIQRIVTTLLEATHVRVNLNSSQFQDFQTSAMVSVRM